MWKEIKSFYKKQKFFEQKPDIYLVLTPEELVQFFKDPLYLIRFINGCISPFKNEKSTFYLVIRSNKLGRIEFRDVEVKTFCEVLLKEVPFRPWFDYNFVCNNPELVNSISYSLRELILHSKYQGKFTGTLYCNSVNDLIDILTNFSIQPDFSVFFLVEKDTGPNCFDKLKKIFTENFTYKNVPFSLYVDYDYSYFETGSLDNFFEFLKVFLDFYLTELGYKNIHIWTFEYLLGTSEPPHCFTGDCTLNNVVIDFSGSVYSCLKSVLYGKPLVKFGNLFEVKEDKVLWLLNHQERTKMIDLHSLKLCECTYWDKCHGCCPFNKIERVGCREFFEYLDRTGKEKYALLAKYRLKEKVKNFQKWVESLKEEPWKSS
ncbi:MAG: hypothetical protein QXR39_08685 [Candidatus Methanomethylicia archaeon]